MNGNQNAIRWNDIYREQSARHVVPERPGPGGQRSGTGGSGRNGRGYESRRTAWGNEVAGDRAGRSVRGCDLQRMTRGNEVAIDRTGRDRRGCGLQRTAWGTEIVKDHVGSTGVKGRGGASGITGHRTDRERERKRAVLERKWKKQRRRRLARAFCACAACFALFMGITAVVPGLPALYRGLFSAPPTQSDTGRIFAADGSGYTGGTIDETQELLQELLEKNEETLDYVSGYADREDYIGKDIDLSSDYTAGEVPLLMQWDRRWGYDAYGKEMIGLAGCGPLCLDMAYLYFTGNTDMTPRKMAEFAYDNGFYTESGTSWSLWTQGCALLGMSGEELPLDEERMKAELDAGGLIVCSMRPGDFTTRGHFILIRGYGEDGFYVNDPNRRSTSGKVWDYETLRPQIRNLWGLRGEG